MRMRECQPEPLRHKQLVTCAVTLLCLLLPLLRSSWCLIYYWLWKGALLLILIVATMLLGYESNDTINEWCNSKVMSMCTSKCVMWQGNHTLGRHTMEAKHKLSISLSLYQLKGREDECISWYCCGILCLLVLAWLPMMTAIAQAKNTVMFVLQAWKVSGITTTDY